MNDAATSVGSPTVTSATAAFTNADVGATVEGGRYRTVNDGSTVASSTTVTSATANFSSQDINSKIYGGSISPNAPATIVAVLSATSVSVDVAPTVTESGLLLTIFSNTYGGIPGFPTIVAVVNPTTVTISATATASATNVHLAITKAGSCIYNSQFVADTASTTCTATGSGVTASTAFTGGVLATATDDNQHPTTRVIIPNNPTPNLTIDGFFKLGAGDTESFTYIFNEQIHNLDGSIIVNASHLIPKGQTAYGDVIFGQSVCGPTAHVTADFANDGKTDIPVFRPSTSTWYVQGGPTVGFGTSGDIPVPGDYDGNGTTDIAVFRPSIGRWFVGASNTGWGTSGDIPVPGDYDGDGKTDIAVFRPSTGTWFVKDGITANFGSSGDIPVPGDYNGDGKTDFAVFRPSTKLWYVLSYGTNNFSGTANAGDFWGATGDIPVPGDYNGDGTTDIAVFRPSTGTWFVKDGITANFGTSGDIPVPGQYNGKAATDIAVFRPSTGTWYVQNVVPTVRWGQSGDVPLPLPDAIRRFFFTPL